MKKNYTETQTICRGYHGSEAEILTQLRYTFPGIGGEIITKEPVTVALRQSYNKIPGTGHLLFLKHTIFKKLDNYFCWTQKYKFPHISRPLGSISGKDKKQYEAYLYEWAFGSDGFPWEYQNFGKSNDVVILDEFDEFSAAFGAAGIDLHSDKSDPDNAKVSQNIVHQLHHLNDFRLNFLWKRIDFGSKSAYINYEKLEKFLKDRSRRLEEVLGTQRLQLLNLAYQYVLKQGNITERDKGRLEILVGNYRISSLRHKTAEIINPRDSYSNLDISQGEEEL